MTGSRRAGGAATRTALPRLHQKVIAAIASPARLRLVVAERTLLAVGDEGDAVRRHSASHQVVHGRLGPALSKRQVVLDRPALITVALDQDELIRVRLQPGRACIEDLGVARANCRL